jgi:hypothetical protein
MAEGASVLDEAEEHGGEGRHGADRTARRGHSVLTAGLMVIAVALLAVVPACTSSSTPATTSTSTSTTSAATVPNQNPAEIAACTADAKTVEVALDAYMAEKGAFPSPPTPWSAATYVANYQALTSASDGGPFLPSPPHNTSYVIAYDSAGHIWVAPPGAYGSYNPGQDFDATPDICDAAVG